MKEERKQKLRESFKAYLKAGKEVNDCADPCLKNGRSDRYCLKCGNEILKPLLE